MKLNICFQEKKKKSQTKEEQQMKILRRLFNKKHEKLIDVWHGNQWLKVKESKLKKCKVVSDRKGKKYLIK